VVDSLRSDNLLTQRNSDQYNVTIATATIIVANVNAVYFTRMIIFGLR
jgi:hypothetical protein